MLSFGSAAFTVEKQLVGTFSANLETLEGAECDPEVMSWWKTQPAAWNACRRDTKPPAAVMPAYRDHLKTLSKRFGKPVFMGYPAAYDFAWMNWYLRQFTCDSPFGQSGLCLKSFAMALLKTPFRDSVKRRFPRRWFDDLPHTHVALDDAIEQGAFGINMVRESRGLPPIEQLTRLEGPTSP